jgi:hypothetical protein
MKCPECRSAIEGGHGDSILCPKCGQVDPGPAQSARRAMMRFDKYVDDSRHTYVSHRRGMLRGCKSDPLEVVLAGPELERYRGVAEAWTWAQGRLDVASGPHPDRFAAVASEAGATVLELIMKGGLHDQGGDPIVRELRDARVGSYLSTLAGIAEHCDYVAARLRSVPPAGLMPQGGFALTHAIEAVKGLPGLAVVQWTDPAGPLRWEVQRRGDGSIWSRVLDMQSGQYYPDHQEWMPSEHEKA